MYSENSAIQISAVRGSRTRAKAFQEMLIGVEQPDSGQMPGANAVCSGPKLNEFAQCKTVKH